MNALTAVAAFLALIAGSPRPTSIPGTRTGTTAQRGEAGPARAPRLAPGPGEKPGNAASSTGGGEAGPARTPRLAPGAGEKGGSAATSTGGGEAGPASAPRLAPGAGEKGGSAASSTGGGEPEPARSIRLESGAELVLLRGGLVPWSSFRVALRIGNALDPPAKLGLARVAGLVIAAGLEESASAEGPRLLGRLGAKVGVETGPTSTLIFGGVPAEHLDEAMSRILAQIAHPPLSDSIVKAAIARTNDERVRGLGDDRLRASLEMRRRLLGPKAGQPAAGAHARPIFGDAQALASITTEDVRALFDRQIRAESVLIGIGDEAPPGRDVERLASKWAEALPRGRAPEAASELLRGAPAGLGRRIVIVDKPQASEAHVVIGRQLAPSSNAAKTPALLAVNAAIGGCFSSRLARVLVERHHLAPLVVSHFDPQASGGTLSIWFTAPPALAPRAVRVALEELRNLARTGLDEPEADFGRAYAAGRAVLELRDPPRHLRAAVAARLFGLPAGAPESLSNEIARVTQAEMRAALEALVAGDDFVIAVVASATPALQAELAGIPGVKDVSIVGLAAGRQ